MADTKKAPERLFTLSSKSNMGKLYDDSIAELAKAGNDGVKAGESRDKVVAISVAALCLVIRPTLPADITDKDFRTQIGRDLRAKSPNGAKHVNVQVTQAWKVVHHPNCAQVAEKWAKGEYTKGGAETLQAMYKSIRPKREKKAEVSPLVQATLWIIEGTFTMEALTAAVAQAKAARVDEAQKATKAA